MCLQPRAGMSGNENAVEGLLMTRFFLGVEHSLTGRAWRDRLDDEAHARALMMVQQYGLPDVLARVLAGRGVSASDRAKNMWPFLAIMMLMARVLPRFSPNG